MNFPIIVSGLNDILVAADGKRYIDLVSANGAALLGHAHPGIGAAIAAQLGELWLIGNLPTPVYLDAKHEVEHLFPQNFQLSGFYSTGMEAAEFALRVARTITGKNGVAGFENSMHGKSLATASLTWNNGDGLHIPGWHRLPFLPRLGEDDILAEVARTLAMQPVGALLVESLLGSAGGHMASPEFYRALAGLAREHGTLLVWDEILTGFHRTGHAFRFLELGVTPDVVLIGKACGNGFPVSGVVVARQHAPSQRMLPGSTYANNPLACTAVGATLRHMGALDMGARAAAVAQVVREHLGWLDESPIALRGQGALWVVELPASADLGALVQGLFDDGVCVGHSGRQFRIMPAATIEPAHLEQACAVISARLRQLEPGRPA